eukprot:scaffold1002_cov110-Skeletonema_menzelii.AAC.2
MNNPQPNNNEELHGYQINCCPIRYVRSDIQPLPPSSTTPLALEERVSSIPSISFSRNSSRSSRTHSSVHSERGIAKTQSILRNSSYATTDADDEEQPDTNIDLQRSISAKAGEDASPQVHASARQRTGVHVRNTPCTAAFSRFPGVHAGFGVNPGVHAGFGVNPGVNADVQSQSN